MEITRGKICLGTRFVVYGPEGIGKSTFVSNIPGIVFIDTEGSTNQMDVMRFPKPTSWEMLMSEVEYAIQNPSEFSAVVIDTADWAEKMCIEHVLASHNWKSIEAPGYGAGYTYVYEEFGRLLNKMTTLAEKGVHVGFCAHAQRVKFEQPEEVGSYDRWELKLLKNKNAPMTKEWADLLLFANYKTLVYATDKDGKKHKAAGGQRVMYANHHPCWDAKNRFGLADELPFDYAQVAHIFQPVSGTFKGVQTSEILPIPPGYEAQPQQQPIAQQQPSIPQEPPQEAVQQAPAPVPTSAPALQPIMANIPESEYQGVPQQLADLMRMDDISPKEVLEEIYNQGVFPRGTPWEAMSAIYGRLVAGWANIKQNCLASRNPF